MRFLPVDPELIKAITLDTPIDDLPLSARIHNCLKGEGLETVRDIAQQPDGFFYRIPNLGRVSISQLYRLMTEAGIETQLRQLVNWLGIPREYAIPAFYQKKIDRNRAIWSARQAGESVASIARRFRLCDYSIRIILARGEREERQLARLAEHQARQRAEHERLARTIDPDFPEAHPS
jgi:hypothetical protein